MLTPNLNKLKIILKI